MNNLYLNISEMAKALRLARFSDIEDYKKGMINYHVLANIFENYKSEEKLNGCKNNIGCIYLRLGDLKLAKEFFEEAISKLEVNEKPCPQCKRNLTRVRGYVHARCDNCDADFCWICLKKKTGAQCINWKINRAIEVSIPCKEIWGWQ